MGACCSCWRTPWFASHLRFGFAARAVLLFNVAWLTDQCNKSPPTASIDRYQQPKTTLQQTMKKSDIYEIAIKLLGLYLFFTSIGLLREVLTTITAMTLAKQNPEGFGDFNQTPFFILSLANFVFVVLFAAFMTLKTKTIVKFICKPTDFKETSSLFAERIVIYEIALVIMGLLLIFWTLPDFAFSLRNHIILVQSKMPNNNYDSNFIIISAIKIIVGLIAIIYAKSIAAILIKEKKDGQTE